MKRFGQSIWQPDFKVCKSEGGTFNCPKEYTKEFSGLNGLSDTVPLGIFWGLTFGVAIELMTGKSVAKWLKIEELVNRLRGR